MTSNVLLQAIKPEECFGTMLAIMPLRFWCIYFVPGIKESSCLSPYTMISSFVVTIIKKKGRKEHGKKLILLLTL
jgi:hypothetical protein